MRVWPVHGNEAIGRRIMAIGDFPGGEHVDFWVTPGAELSVLMARMLSFDGVVAMIHVPSGNLLGQNPGRGTKSYARGNVMRPTPVQKRLPELVETDLATASIAEIVECDGTVDLDCNAFTGIAEALAYLDGSGKFFPDDETTGFATLTVAQNTMGCEIGAAPIEM